MKGSRMRRFLAGVAIVAVFTGVTSVGSVGAQVSKVSYTSVSFNEGISGVETDLAGLLDVLRAHTEIDGEPRLHSSRLRFAYGIGHGDDVFAVSTSDAVLLTHGTKPYVKLGGGPIDTPWDAFEDPLVGFEDPLVGFTDPLLGFEEPALGFDGSIEAFEEPALGLEAIWGNGNIGIDPGDYGLIIFTMPDPDARSDDVVQYHAAVVPFSITEAG